MLLVNATKGPSAIHGIGLIAREYVPAGTLVWIFQPGFDRAIDVQTFCSLSAPAREQLLFYCYFDFGRRLYVLSSDDDRFTNHSDTPNTEDHPTMDATVATMDILPEQEITWSYRATASWHLNPQLRDRFPHESPSAPQ